MSAAAGRRASGGRSAILGAATAPDGASAGMVLTFVVPMPAITTNRQHGASRHWRAIHGEKVAYWRDLDVIATWCRRFGSITVASGDLRGTWEMPPEPSAPLHRVALSSSMVLHGAMDDDNAIARHKPLCDWLVARGYLATDRRERKKDGASCRWAALPEQRVSRKEAARITLTLTEVRP